MKYGYVKVATYTPSIELGNSCYNLQQIKEGIKNAYSQNIELLVMPELCLTGYTCADLFLTDILLTNAYNCLGELVEFTKGYKMLVLVGLPFKLNNNVYNVGACICDGKLLAIIPKTNLKDSNGYSESRYFKTYQGENIALQLFGQSVPFGNKILLKDKLMPSFSVCVEISTDINLLMPPSFAVASCGGNIIANLGLMEEYYSSQTILQNFISTQSTKAVCGYIYANAGDGESTSDCVYVGSSFVYQNGKLLAKSKPNSNLLVSQIDCDYISYLRSKENNFNINSEVQIVEFSCCNNNQELITSYSKTPFVPTDIAELKECATTSLELQAQALKSRLERSYSKTAVLGLSGGLDSTLAILVAVKAMEKLNRQPEDVIAVTMPCFGTTSRTYQNTIKLAKALKVTLKKVDITKSVTRHLKDIKHDGAPNVTFENAQARERTQVLMDIANMCNGLVVGTGDLSELALGWATYNGDHMSMYAVNCSVPKTLVRCLVEEYAFNSKGKLKSVLMDILDTPVSPELLPTENDKITQKT